jgi:hypothetical protein
MRAEHALGRSGSFVLMNLFSVKERAIQAVQAVQNARVTRTYSMVASRPVSSRAVQVTVWTSRRAGDWHCQNRAELPRCRAGTTVARVQRQSLKTDSQRVIMARIQTRFRRSLYLPSMS